MLFLRSILESSLTIFFTTFASAIALRIANAKPKKRNTTQRRRKRKGG